ncbi:ATP-binding cassette domain-containing protein [Rhodococcus aerolatus]
MISVRDLTKVYDGRTVVDHVGFDLVPGTVTAFLGPNGAGKSTTLRAICGLTLPTSGSATVAGRRYTEWPNPAHVVGVCLDASAVHPARSGRTHLRQLAGLSGVPRRRVDELLERLGLAAAATRRIGAYSLGMRQRLGLAAALLADPPVLVLDEPINGLDPDGIREVRTLLRGHASRGGTVLLSSHVLAEVDQTADRVLVIGTGRVLADGPLGALTRSGSSRVRARDPRGLVSVLARAGIPWRDGGDGSLVVAAGVEQVSDVAFAAGVQLVGLAPEQLGLEELFFRLTRGGGAP